MKKIIKIKNVEGIEITSKVNLNENDLIENTYHKIIYNNTIFNLSSRFYIKQQKNNL